MKFKVGDRVKIEPTVFSDGGYPTTVGEVTEVDEDDLDFNYEVAWGDTSDWFSEDELEEAE